MNTPVDNDENKAVAPLARCLSRYRSLCMASVRQWLLHLCLLLACAQPALACTEEIMLDLIGALEAPNGYDTVYYGVRVNPPRPITTMTVDAVLDWQRRAVRGGSVSTAAGRYQIIRPTLQGLVDAGVVSLGDTFDAATQDRLGRHLLRQTGYRAGANSPAIANRIAGVWAALPRIGGTGAGRSVYEGVADNHALVRSDTYQGVLDCRIAVADIAPEVAAIRKGMRFGFTWDRFLEDLAHAAGETADALIEAGTLLLLVLFGIDLVWRGGKWAFSSETLTYLMDGFLFRLLAVLFCLAILNAGGEVIHFIADTAAGLARSAGANQPFSMAKFAASKMALAFSLYEGIGSAPMIIQLVIYTMSTLIIVLAALQIGVVIYWYARLFLAAAAGILTVGFGGLSQGMAAARAWLVTLVATGLSLMALLLVLNLTPSIAWDMRSSADPFTTAPILIFIESLALLLMFMLPRAAGELVKAMR